MPETIRLFIVAPDGELARKVRVADRQGEFETVRFRSFAQAAEKALREPGVSLLAQWSVTDLREDFPAPEIGSLRWLPFPVAAFCPDLPRLSPVLGAEVRFTLLELGAVAVCSKSRRLPGILSIFRRYAAKAAKISSCDDLALLLEWPSN